MTKAFTHKGKPLTDERAENIAAVVLADLDAMSDDEARKRTRPPGSLAKRIGRPRVGGAEGTGPSTQVRVRVSGELLDQLDAQAASSHRSRSEIIRDALEAHLRTRWPPPAWEALALWRRCHQLAGPKQAIRPAVVNRKVWGGNRTWRGAATQGRIMSAIRTATQQGIDPIDFLIRLARAPDPGAISLFAWAPTGRRGAASHSDRDVRAAPGVPAPTQVRWARAQSVAAGDPAALRAEPRRVA